MNHKRTEFWVAAAVLTVLCAGPALAQTPTIDYYGYGWEEGGMPPSDPGDELIYCGVADDVDPIFEIDLGDTELTVIVTDLISTGTVDLGGGITMINYTGGTMRMYTDGAMNADWGTFPPNATAPSTFLDGDLFFEGDFLDFTIFMTADGYGSFEGHLNGYGGEMLGEPCTDCVYTWGGSFYSSSGALMPDGYDVQLDGVFEVDPAVSNDDMSWSDVKALYRD